MNESEKMCINRFSWGPWTVRITDENLGKIDLQNQNETMMFILHEGFFCKNLYDSIIVEHASFRAK